MKHSEEKRITVLFVENDLKLRQGLIEILKDVFPEFDFQSVGTESDALDTIDRCRPFDIVLSDMRLADRDEGGIAVVKCAKQKDPLTQVIVVTNYPTYENIYRALEAGASYYVDRNYTDYQYTLVALIKKALDLKNELIGLNSLIESLVGAIDAKDEYTSGHSKRVKDYALAIADGLVEFPDNLKSDLAMAAILHDIGKVAVNNCLLHKPGKLTDLEKMIVNMHAQKGSEILRTLSHREAILQGIADHHKFFSHRDGSGPAIKPSLFGQIIAVADAFDAMTSQRSYRAKIDLDSAKKEIINNRGYQFSPETVDSFLRIFDRIRNIHETGSNPG